MDRIRQHPWMTVYLAVGVVLFTLLYTACEDDEGANIGCGMIIGIWFLPGLVWCLARLNRNLHPPRN